MDGVRILIKDVDAGRGIKKNRMMCSVEEYKGYGIIKKLTKEEIKELIKETEREILRENPKLESINLNIISGIEYGKEFKIKESFKNKSFGRNVLFEATIQHKETKVVSKVYFQASTIVKVENMFRQDKRFKDYYLNKVTKLETYKEK